MSNMKRGFASKRGRAVYAVVLAVCLSLFDGRIPRAFADAVWTSCIESPNWMDFRKAKNLGRVKESHPDFKDPDRGLALWLTTDSNTPDWVPEKLQGLPDKHWVQALPTVDSDWEDIVNNPSNWMDFRVKKFAGELKDAHPDFKSVSGDLPVWMKRAPRWFVEKIETLQPGHFAAHQETQKSTPTRAVTSSIKEQLWISVFDEPEDWLDFRDAKNCGAVKPKHPDFKPKEKYHRTLNSLLLDNTALWLNDPATPDWVHKMLQGKPRLWEKKGSTNDPDDQDDLRVQKESGGS